MTNEPPPVTVFTFFLSLPYAVPVPDGSTPGFVGRRTSDWDGWSPELLAALVGIPEPFSEQTAPGTRMAIRHRELTVPVPPAAAFEAFKDWIEPPLPPAVFQHLSEDTAKWGASGMPIVVSIVALSRFVPRSAHPRADEMTVGWLLGLFRSALADLNSFLEALGLVSQRWDIGTLSPRSLPSMVPLLVESSHLGPADEKQGATAIFPLHDAALTPPQRFEPSSELFAGAKGLSNAANQGDQPYMLVLRLIHGAEGERLAGDPTRAMIDLNTAVEVLVSVTVSEAGRLVGWDEDRVSRAISWRTGLKKRVSEHLSAVLGEPIDVKDGSQPWGRWFTGGYRLQNAAVHEGRDLRKAEVDTALAEAEDVLSDLQRRLSRHGAFEHLASRLDVPVRVQP